jgi:hypothetical protein
MSWLGWTGSYRITIGLLVVVAAIAAAIAVAVQRTDATLGPEVLYLTDAPRVPSERMQELGRTEIVADRGAFDARFDVETTWAVLYDGSLAIDARFLRHLFESGVVVIGVERTPLELRSDVQAFPGGSLEDIERVAPSGVRLPSDRFLQEAGAFAEDFVTYAVRVSATIYAQHQCFALASGQRSFADSWSWMERSLPLTGQALVELESGEVTLACQ